MVKGPIVIGITGLPGCGKSAMAKEWARMGALVIDMDRVGHTALTEPQVIRQLAKAFGGRILVRGRVDRARLAMAAFSSRSGVVKLNRIMHPRMTRLLRAEMAAARRRRCPVVVDAALLFEAGWNRLVDRTVAVRCPERVRLDRLAARGIPRASARARERAQWSESRKAARADLILRNAGSAGRLRRIARFAWHRFFRNCT